MYKTLMTVVLYDKTYADSSTINSLRNKSYIHTDLIILNMGPNPISFDKNIIHTLGFYFNSISTREYLDGRLLSQVCNDIISSDCDHERFIFLDGNSTLHKGYLNKLDSLYSENVDLQIPNVISVIDERFDYPIINGAVLNFDNGFEIYKNVSLMSLGAGLVFYRSLLEKFRIIKADVFDKGFSLNSVDRGFLTKLETLKFEGFNVNIQIIDTFYSSFFGSVLPCHKLNIFYRVCRSIKLLK